MRDHQTVAEQLADAAPEPDDIQRARMERGLLEAVKKPREPEPEPPRSRSFVAGVGVGLAAAAAALLVWWLGRPEPEPVAEVSPTTVEIASSAVFESLRDGVPVRSGAFVEGETIQTTEGQLLRARFGELVDGERAVLVEVQPRSRAHFAEIDGDAMRLSVTRGAVRVEFHPERRGEQTLEIDTPAARVEVVGTVFHVEVDASGTRVRVDEGRVRVVPREGEPRFVSGGDETRVTLTTTARTTTTTPDVEPVEEERAETPSPRRALEALGEVLADPALEELADEVAPETEVPEDATESAEAPEVPVVTMDANARLALAQRYFDRREFERARREAEIATQETSSRAVLARAWDFVGQTYAREDNPRQAADAYLRAANEGRGTARAAEALFKLGHLRAGQGRRAAAAAAFRRYVAEYPEGPLAVRAREQACALGGCPGDD